MKTHRIAFILIAAALTGCAGSDESSSSSENPTVSDQLHLSFTTPDWNRFINCDQLDLYPSWINDATNSVSATSASTRETFCFSVPADSSAMVLPSNLKKYPIRNYFENQAPFEFSQKLPVTPSAQTYLISNEGQSEESYNEVVEIKYVSSEPDFALFKVKCRYKMTARELGNESNVKAISGTFHFKVRTSKN